MVGVPWLGFKLGILCGSGPALSESWFSPVFPWKVTHICSWEFYQPVSYWGLWKCTFKETALAVCFFKASRRVQATCLESYIFIITQLWSDGYVMIIHVSLKASYRNISVSCSSSCQGCFFIFVFKCGPFLKSWLNLLQYASVLYLDFWPWGIQDLSS